MATEGCLKRFIFLPEIAKSRVSEAVRNFRGEREWEGHGMMNWTAVGSVSEEVYQTLTYVGLELREEVRTKLGIISIGIKIEAMVWHHWGKVTGKMYKYRNVREIALGNACS